MTPRLPLLPPDRQTPAQRALYDDSLALIRKSGLTHFKSVNADGALLGPWTVLMQQPAIGTAHNRLIEAIGGLGRLSMEAKQVAILVVGAHYRAAYELYAHVATAEHAGMPKPKVTTLAAGNRPDDLTNEEAVTFDVAKALVEGGVLPGDVFLAARKVLGEEALYELVLTVGLYAQVSVLLNAFDIPAEHDF